LLMGEDKFGIEGMTLCVDGKPVGTFTEDQKLFDTIALTVEDDGSEDGLWGGFSFEEVNCRVNDIKTKLLLEILFGRCRSGRWRLRKRALDMIHLSRMRKEREYDKRLGIDYGKH